VLAPARIIKLDTEQILKYTDYIYISQIHIEVA